MSFQVTRGACGVREGDCDPPDLYEMREEEKGGGEKNEERLSR